MPSQVCISFAQNYCCLAYAQNSQQHVDVGVFYDDLKQKVQAHGMTGAQTLAVLANGDYQLLIAKKPDVPESKIKEALLWQEQARFSLPLDQIILEYFECREIKGEQKFYIVAVAKQQLQTKYQAMNAAGLKVTRITIPELVYASYVQRELRSYACVIWINIFPDQSRALLFANGGLVSTLRLPKIEQEADEANQEAMSQALKLFYHEQALLFTGVESDADSLQAPDHAPGNLVWAVNCFDAVLAKALSALLPGQVTLLDLPAALAGDLSLSKEIAISHAVYGVVTEK